MVDEYYKEIEVGGEATDLYYGVFLLLIACVIAVLPDYGIWMGAILILYSVIKLVMGDKDYARILMFFLIGLFVMVFSGFFIGELIMAIILGIIGGYYVFRWAGIIA